MTGPDEHAPHWSDAQVAALMRDEPPVATAEARAALIDELAKYGIVGRDGYPHPTVTVWVLRDGEQRRNPWTEWVEINQLDPTLWMVSVHHGLPGEENDLLHPPSYCYTTTLERTAIAAGALGTGDQHTYGIVSGGLW